MITYSVGWVEGHETQHCAGLCRRHTCGERSSNATSYNGGNRAAGVAPQPTIFR